MSAASSEACGALSALSQVLWRWLFREPGLRLRGYSLNTFSWLLPESPCWEQGPLLPSVSSLRVQASFSWLGPSGWVRDVRGTEPPRGEVTWLVCDRVMFCLINPGQLLYPHPLQVDKSLSGESCHQTARHGEQGTSRLLTPPPGKEAVTQSALPQSCPGVQEPWASVPGFRHRGSLPLVLQIPQF